MKPINSKKLSPNTQNKPKTVEISNKFFQEIKNKNKKTFWLQRLGVLLDTLEETTQNTNKLVPIMNTSKKRYKPEQTM